MLSAALVLQQEQERSTQDCCAAREQGGDATCVQTEENDGAERKDGRDGAREQEQLHCERESVP